LGVVFYTLSGLVGMIPVSHIEHVTDKPRATGVTVGVIKRF
jgi:hypothetical protein